MKMKEAATKAGKLPVGSILRRGLLSGSLASLFSTLVIARRSKADGGNLYCGTNATSHWIWGERAYHRKGVSVRYTLVGYLIHHICSVFWATIFTAWRSWRLTQRLKRNKSGGEVVVAPPPGKRSLQRGRDLGESFVMAALAATVDYTITPHRLRPGYERHLKRPSLVAVYAAFGLGLAAGTCCLDLYRRRCS
jgi:hypothetical protein